MRINIGRAVAFAAGAATIMAVGCPKETPPSIPAYDCTSVFLACHIQCGDAGGIVGCDPFSGATTECYCGDMPSAPPPELEMCTP